MSGSSMCCCLKKLEKVCEQGFPSVTRIEQTDNKSDTGKNFLKLRSALLFSLCFQQMMLQNSIDVNASRVSIKKISHKLAVDIINREEVCY